MNYVTDEIRRRKLHLGSKTYILEALELRVENIDIEDISNSGIFLGDWNPPAS